jgi:hypothetical protein
MRGFSSDHRFDLQEKAGAGAFPAGVLLILIVAIAISLGMPWD